MIVRKYSLRSLISASVFILLLLFVSAGAAHGSESGDFAGLDFEELRAVIAAIAETEEYPHFLIENAERYETFQAMNPDMPFGTVIALVNVNVDKGEYNYIQTVADPYKITALVNKNFALPSDWTPYGMVDIGGNHLLREEAAERFIEMRESMREADLTMSVVITYRSYASQRNLFNNAVARHGRASAERGFAKSGHSEHQTGLALDILHRAHAGGLMIHQGFENSRQFDWLVENAHTYGFILRYPRGYTHLSGYIFEPWHWRYVGIPIATAMHNDGIALYEEFYGRYLIQGVLDKVEAYILEQQAIAEALALAEAEAAALAAAEAEAAALAAIAEAEAAELARAEAAAIAAAEAEAAALAAAIAAEAEAAARKYKATSANRHFLEIIALIGILPMCALLHFSRKKQ